MEGRRVDRGDRWKGDWWMDGWMDGWKGDGWTKGTGGRATRGWGNEWVCRCRERPGGGDGDTGERVMGMGGLGAGVLGAGEGAVQRGKVNLK